VKPDVGKTWQERFDEAINLPLDMRIEALRELVDEQRGIARRPLPENRSGRKMSGVEDEE
jgi:hypothetical protein